jgi:hypothetical protein
VPRAQAGVPRAQAQAGVPRAQAQAGVPRAQAQARGLRRRQQTASGGAMSAAGVRRRRGRLDLSEHVRRDVTVDEKVGPRRCRSSKSRDSMHQKLERAQRSRSRWLSSLRRGPQRAGRVAMRLQLGRGCQVSKPTLGVARLLAIRGSGRHHELSTSSATKGEVVRAAARDRFVG